MNWQPIETAPRDGTQVLICTAGFEHFQKDGLFVEQKCFFFWIAYWQTDSSRPELGRFVSADDLMEVCHPTHWAALTPPKEAA